MKENQKAELGSPLFIAQGTVARSSELGEGPNLILGSLQATESANPERIHHTLPQEVCSPKPLRFPALGAEVQEKEDPGLARSHSGVGAASSVSGGDEMPSARDKRRWGRRGGGGAGAVRGWWRTSCTQRDAHRGSVPCWLAQRRFLQQGGELAGKAVPPGMPSSFVAPLAAKLGVKKNQSHFVLSDARGPGS